MKPHFYVIGCGGVGSWLTPALCLLHSPGQVTLMDGDTLERKNMDRQLFTSADLGKNKSEALAKRYRCRQISKWFSFGDSEYRVNDVLVCCADNNIARMAVLDESDRYNCHAFFAANERTSAEAYYYQPAWKGTKLDPRVYYPEMTQDRSGDPRQAAIGCTGQAQVETPQLVSANSMAAALLVHLIMVWTMEAPNLSKETLQYLEYKIVKNMSGTESFKVGQSS